MNVNLVSLCKGKTLIKGFEDAMLKRIFGPKREEVIQDRRKL
jgi:hypothetical protein